MTGVSVRFDEATGRLQLDQAAFAALGASAAGPVPAGGPDGDADRSTALGALRAAGVLVGNGSEVHPLVARALRAIASPARRLLLRLAARSGHEAQVAAWIDGDVVALLVDCAGFAGHAPDHPCEDPSEHRPPYDLLTLHPSFLPAVVARLIGLGERLTVAGRPTDGGVAGSPPLNMQGPDDRLLTGQEATIRVWPGPAPAPERVVRVRRTGTGWWLDDPEAAPPSRVTTSTQVWAALTGLLAP